MIFLVQINSEFLNLNCHIMKKLTILLSLMVLAVSISFAGVGKYYVDDNAVESLFATSTEVALPEFTTPTDLSSQDLAILSADKNVWVAVALSYFLGYLGVHRLYLGSSTGVFIGYLCTGGLFGIAYSIDCIVLLIGAIQDDISKYVDNTRFLMWL